ncbi:MAG: Flp pilus assembly protein CpaB [candidate division WOR-3 bacterium]
MRPNVRRLLIALSLAGIAALLLISYIQDVERKTLMKGAPERVLVAKKDISARTIISEDLVEYREIPKPFIEPLAVSNIGEIIGMVAITDIRKGEQITKNLLLPLQTWTVLSSLIPEGYRAITIHVDEVSGVGGLILPGDEVDVVATFSLEDLRRYIPEQELERYLRSPQLYRVKGPYSSFATITYKAVRVLAVGRSLLALPPTVTEKKTGFMGMPETYEAGSVSSVTFAVPKEIAKELALLEKVANIRLVLRSVREIKLPGEDTIIEKPLTVFDILEKYTPKPKPKKVAKAAQTSQVSPYSYINIYKRTDLEQVKLRGSEVVEQKPWEEGRRERFEPGKIMETFMGSYMKGIENVLKQAGVKVPANLQVPCDTCF